MEDQLTVRLPKELGAALREKAARMQRKRSEVVRMAVVEFLQIPDDHGERPVERVRDLIGSLRSEVFLTGIQSSALAERLNLVDRRLNRLLLDTGALVGLLDRSQKRSSSLCRLLRKLCRARCNDRSRFSPMRLWWCSPKN